MRSFPVRAGQLSAWGSAAILLLTGCQTVYYQAMEKIGYQKHEILVDRVKDARDAQEKTKEQFQDALEQFSAMVNFDGGQLQGKYDHLKSVFSRCETRSQALSKRIADVEHVAQALFKEWETELRQYSSANLRRSSERKLDQTRLRYGELLRAMRRAEKKVDPVLAAFRDQVLFLKHNLNARAIASLQSELDSIQTDVAALVREMESAIAEAEGFIQTLGK